ncbi:MAG: 4Fe-4S dicluster domain-containing protein [bacterium]|nr:4Fe-4S dicluster domain-containing protein [bacterium]
MNEDLYIQLREHLDKMPAGFPKTKSGAELKLLKRFYTTEQAQIALQIQPAPQKASAIAERLNMDTGEAAVKVEEMAAEGLVFRIKTPDGSLYMQPNFIMGIYEWHVNSIDKEIAEFADDYYDAMFEHHWKERETKQLRVVPVDTSIKIEDSIQNYDKIRELVKSGSGGPYAAAPCICREEQMKKGNTVTRPLETCLTFGLAAQYYIENKIGRQLTEEELMLKLKECEDANLVPFSTNSLEIVNMCMCDKDSCQLFRNLNQFDKPAEEVHTSFYATIKKDLCSGCNLCQKKCQLHAIDEEKSDINKTGKVFQVNLDRCIGCGLCVSKCPTGAVAMNLKAEPMDIPQNKIELDMRMAQERQKSGV